MHRYSAYILIDGRAVLPQLRHSSFSFYLAFFPSHRALVTTYSLPFIFRVCPACRPLRSVIRCAPIPHSFERPTPDPRSPDVARYPSAAATFGETHIASVHHIPVLLHILVRLHSRSIARFASLSQRISSSAISQVPDCACPHTGSIPAVATATTQAPTPIDYTSVPQHGQTDCASLTHQHSFRTYWAPPSPERLRD